MNFSNEPKPLTVSVNEKKEELAAKPTYFFERPDKSIIFVEEREAWSLYSKVSQILGVRTYPFKFLGSSDGRKYQQALFESQEIFKETGDIAKAQERLRLGEKEELEVARGHMVPPRNLDNVDLHGNPTNLLNI